MSVVIGVFVAALVPDSIVLVTRALIGWNVAVWLYLALIAHTIRTSTHEHILRHAGEQDEGRIAILFGSILAASASVGSIIALLATSKDVVGLEKAWHLGLAFATILAAWTFVHVSFAMHYAHVYYDTPNDVPDPARAKTGLIFPGVGGPLKEPDYEDFLYFSLTIGVASQTADVTVASKAMRRVVLLQSVMSFFFNAAVLALTINIAASLV